MIYLKLLWSFFQVGLFSFGGGYAALPQIQYQVVDLNHWLSLSEFADVITISQITPGPIATAAATFVGMKTAGISGAVVAIIGSVIPSIVIALFLAFIYSKYKNLKGVQGVLGGIRPAVVAMIASASLAVLLMALFGDSLPRSFADVNFISIAFLVVCVIILRKFKINPVYIMLGAGVVGVAWYFIHGWVTAAG